MIIDRLMIGPRLTVTLASGETVRQQDLENIQDFVNASTDNAYDAIGDIHNTANYNNILGTNPLFISNLGRVIGDMSKIEPIYRVTGKLATSFVSTDGLTYNVIPHPDNTAKCMIGCKHDGYRFQDDLTRDCLKNKPTFYNGTPTTICDNTGCPLWSGQVDTGGEFEYRIVFPAEDRDIVTYSLIASFNAGLSVFNKYRFDDGPTFKAPGSLNDFWTTMDQALRSTSGFIPIQYHIPYTNDGNATVRAEIFVPKIAARQNMTVNTVSGPFTMGEVITGGTSGATAIFIQKTSLTNFLVGPVSGTFAPIEVITGGTSTETANMTVIADVATTYNVYENGVLAGSMSPDPNTDYVSKAFDISIVGRTRVDLSIANADTTIGAWTLVSMVRLFNLDPVEHPNFGITLTYPSIFNQWKYGGKIPDNMMQLFDTVTNSTITNVTFMKALFDKNTPYSAVDVKLSQALVAGTNRYLVYTVGTDIMTLLGRLVESFLKHISDQSIHLTATDICALMSNSSLCCEDLLTATVTSVNSSIIEAVPGTLFITFDIAGGTPPYKVDVQWGDGSGNVYFSDNDDTTTMTISHTYSVSGIYAPTVIVYDGRFNCSVDLTDQIGRIVVGNVVGVELEQRLGTYAAYTYVSDVPDTITSGTELVLVGNRSRSAETFSWNVYNPDNNRMQIYVELFEVIDTTGSFPGGPTTTIDLSGAPYNETEVLRQNSIMLQDATGAIFLEGTNFTVAYGTRIITSVTIPTTPLTIQYKTYPVGTVAPVDTTGGNPATAGDEDKWVFVADTRNTNIDITTLATGLVPDVNEIDVVYMKIDA